MIRKITVLLMLFGITLGVNAQLLWKISGKDLPKPSYIVGTHHLAPITIIDSIAGFRQVLNEAEQIYGELVMSEMQNPANMQKMQQAIILPGDTTLHTLLTEAQYDSVAVAIKQMMGVDLKMLDKMKPSFLTSQIAVLLAVKTIKGYNPQQQLDIWIQDEGKKQGKTIGGLETMDFQTNVLFNSQSLQRQAQQLYHTVIHLNTAEQQTLKLTDAYMRQDLRQMEEVLNERTGTDYDPLPEEEEILIYGRNANWGKLMPALMKEKPTLFAVGAAHLLGERGVLNLLRQQGYHLEAVR